MVKMWLYVKKKLFFKDNFHRFLPWIKIKKRAWVSLLFRPHGLFARNGDADLVKKT